MFIERMFVDNDDDGTMHGSFVDGGGRRYEDKR